MKAASSLSSGGETKSHQTNFTMCSVFPSWNANGQHLMMCVEVASAAE